MSWRLHQIFYLEQGETRLYGELIQFVEERHLCWLRPIALHCQSRNDASTGEAFYDLRQGADLICPDTLLHLALDHEVLPILTQLHDLKDEAASSHNADRLRQFVQQLWQAEPEAFQQ
ncbi:MAG: hypothetical protein KME07_24925 [Pegethrix bostrychoides GSE-TBD4-15B]|jgi:hypothetical protein|uniref:Uncharacterized protein n=1 Tax=Pegethrix bostrychoides GSE-TBD4-15B TaxID=2839662 RepID=A0A951PFH6_9CYAN|nr:hypothetical protein [Pegethrix bostrychoides GSE-TBD4-15B]